MNRLLIPTLTMLMAAFAWAAPSGTTYQKLCSACHGKKGEGSLELKAPSIAGLPDWYTLSQIEKITQDVRSADTNDVHLLAMREIVKQVSKKDLKQAVTYIQSLKPHPTTNTLGGNATKGAILYEQFCMECHRFNASGERVFKSPPLTGLQDWYMAAQFKNYRTLSRGPRQDLYGHKMHTVATRLKNPQDLHDILAWIAEIAAKKAELPE